MKTALKKRTGQTGIEANQEKRFKRFEIRFTTEEWNFLQQRALDAGANSLALYARSILLPEQNKKHIETKKEYLLRLQLLASLGKIGSNINQIARSLNRLKVWNETTKGMFDQLIKIQEGISTITKLFKDRK